MSLLIGCDMTEYRCSVTRGAQGKRAMNQRNQYSQTHFIASLTTSTSSKQLERIHFAKLANGFATYDEAWLQRLIMSHPSLLPIDEIEPAFGGLVPVCMELPVPSGYLGQPARDTVREYSLDRVQAVAKSGGKAGGRWPDYRLCQ